MSRPPIIRSCLLVACIAGCGGPGSRPGPATAPAAEHIEWQGLGGCADCDLIQTDLVLEQAEGSRRYTLTEIYVSGSLNERFVERGRWRSGRGQLRLEGDTASLRVYALLPDGRLQACDRHGQPLPGSAVEPLLPVAFSTSD